MGANHHLNKAGDLRLVCSSGLYDQAWYVAINPDVAMAGVDPLIQYLCNGGFEGCDPRLNFCSSWYLDAYIDVIRNGANPLVHYLGT